MTRLRTRHLAAPLVAAALLTAPVTAHAAPRPQEEARTLDWVAVPTEDSAFAAGLVHPGAAWTVYAHLHENDGGRPGKRIGDATARCNVVKVNQHGHVTQCERVLRTEAGHLTLADMMDHHHGSGPHSAPAAVTGGTGAYADAEGEATVAEHDGHTTFRIVLDD
ncbi:hypothetical protein ACFPM3_02050 [Streptomyces coeruleoprunus]|uniref:Uncharacterized protein n=1 Tax=Streptomyces coeruleoprunus TaxID=285563 RepID=A0ABV9X9W0_9ACTN